MEALLDRQAKPFTATGLSRVHGDGDARGIEQVHAALDAARASINGLSATLAQARRDLVRAEGVAGTVKRIEPFGRMKISALGIEEQRVNLINGFDAASTGRAARLGHGFQLDATVILWQRPDALRVPIGALFRAPGGRWQVFAIEGGRARRRDVTIGRIDRSHGEVLAGLRDGEVVVLNPPTRVSDNTKVAPR